MEEKNTKKENKTNKLALIGIILIILAIFLLLGFFLSGETKVSGEWSGIEKSETIVCGISGKDYPFFTYNKAQDKTTKVNIIFDGDKITAISLTHILYYDNEKAIIDSENLNHVAMNENFGTDSLGFDALGLKFSKFDEGLQMSLYTREVNDRMLKYFMLDGTSTYDMAKLQQIYESQGFKCEINNK